MALPFQRLVANLLDTAALIYIVLNVHKYFDVAGMLPKFASRHYYFILVFYFYFILTILPHHFFGQTFGQLLTGVRVTTANFKRPSLVKIILRDLLRPTTVFFPTPVLRKKTRAWYDNFLKTTIVDVR